MDESGAAPDSWEEPAAPAAAAAPEAPKAAEPMETEAASSSAPEVEEAAEAVEEMKVSGGGKKVLKERDARDTHTLRVHRPRRRRQVDVLRADPVPDGAGRRADDREVAQFGAIRRNSAQIRAVRR